MPDALSGNMKSAGWFPPFFSIYIHVPFCWNLCDFCHFYRVKPREIEAYLDALAREVDSISGTISAPVRSVYVGGGTPSVLPARFYESLFRHLDEAFFMDGTSESSIEVVPGAGTDELGRLQEAGFGRVSIGIKSFDPDSLAALGVRREEESAERSVEAARSAGFISVGIDLVYGFSGQEEESFINDLQTALLLDPDHISLYSLVQSADSGPREINQDTAAAMFTESIRTLIAGGYRQYEICNFAKPGHECLHNINYWRDGDFIGLGPSAHSAVTAEGTRSRWRNAADLAAYMADPGSVKEELCVEGPEIRPAEALMLALRQTEGVDIDHFILRYGKDPRIILGSSLKRFRELGLIRTSARRIRLTTRGMLLSNEVFGAIV